MKQSKCICRLLTIGLIALYVVNIAIIVLSIVYAFQKNDFCSCLPAFSIGWLGVFLESILLINYCVEKIKRIDEVEERNTDPFVQKTLEIMDIKNKKQDAKGENDDH